ncbi:MAG TPA: AI-2E family transporter [Stellaceae bacterium]|nr:AI-2E family transporter [Stellaceae bacterium]
MTTQRAALLVLTAALTLLAMWILRHFLPALAWAAVLAIATWPLYEWLLARLAGPWQHAFLVPLLFTLLVGIVFVLPLTLFAIEAGHEALVLVRWARTIEQDGLPVPDWVAHVPFGANLAAWWRVNLADAAAAKELIGRIDRSVLFEWTRSIGIVLLGRSTILVFTLLALFFLYRDGRAFISQVATFLRRVFGHAGEEVGQHVVAAVRGTVDGLVLVGLAEGVLLGIGYAVAGLPHATLLGAATCVLAMIPFGAPLIFGLCALYLLAEGSVPAAVALAIYGVVVTFIADHFARPALIGGTVRLPFLWVLLGLLGGVESFGLLGLFVGPAVMAALMALWREWAAEPAAVLADRSPPRALTDRSAPPD